MPTVASTRRNLLRGSLVAGAALALPMAASAQVPARRRALRIAHITDTHIQPERGAAEGVEMAFKHIQSQADKIDLVLHTGDIIMEGFATKSGRVKTQWDLWTSVVKNGLSLPIHCALGNHDIWGWDKTKSETTGDEPQHGKRWACDILGRATPYTAFDAGGWHFVILDSIRPFGDTSYCAYLDDEQFEWLRTDLAAVPETMPVCVASHVPILSVTPFLFSSVDPAATQPARDASGVYKPTRGDYTVSGALGHGDFRKLQALFAKHKNVRLAVSGHTHLVDRVDYMHTSFCCGGAISSGWWKSVHKGECDYGYNVYNLYEDGSFDREYVAYGWTTRDS
jgi:3',5'-cyclic-AMP phosphodiesterase